MTIRIGNGGDNILNGTNGSDLLLGAGGNDVLNGGGGIDILSGGGGNDTLNGGSGSDLVSGDAGNDTLIYKAAENTGGIDLYDGGSGTDTLRLELTTAEWANGSMKADVAAFLEDPNHAFVWRRCRSALPPNQRASSASRRAAGSRRPGASLRREL